MSVPRQDPMQAGRVHQKNRTRTAIVDAAASLLAGGSTPTVAQAAEAALVSRTTAYRYFPTQESLLLEVTVTADVAEIESLVATPLDASDVVERAVAVVRLFNDHVAAAETRYRTALRLYLDMSLSAAEGDIVPTVREGRRVRWFNQVLSPLRGRVPDAELDRIVAGLSLLVGGEALVVLRDVCGLDAAGAGAVTEWAARTLLATIAP